MKTPFWRMALLLAALLATGVSGALAADGPVPAATPGGRASAAASGELDAALQALARRWAEINYAPDASKRSAGFEVLAERAAALVAAWPGRPEPLIWQGIVLSSWAGAQGGLGALGHVKASRKALEAALAIDPDALNGSALTSLGALYYQVPGWPISFGDDDRARDYLRKALAVNPDGIDPNWFWGDFLAEQHDWKASAQALEHALAAPARPGRSFADAQRRLEIQARLEDVRTHL